MEILSDYDIALAKYVMESETGEASDATVAELSAAIENDKERYITTVDNLVMIAMRKKDSGSSETEAIVNLEGEYKRLGLGRKFCSFDYINSFVEILISKSDVAMKPFSEIRDMISAAYQQGMNCPYTPVRNGLILYTLRLSMRFDILMRDSAFANEVMSQVNMMTQDEKEQAIVPSSFIREI